jgi:hypothetical protein
MEDRPDPPKPRGRPKAEEPRAPVTAWVPATLHDQLVKQATQSGESVSRTIRRLLGISLQNK